LKNGGMKLLGNGLRRVGRGRKDTKSHGAFWGNDVEES
jgi:hypothetical protein